MAKVWDQLLEHTLASILEALSPDKKNPEKPKITTCPHCFGLIGDIIAKYRIEMRFQRRYLSIIDNILLHDQRIKGWEFLSALRKYYTSIQYEKRQIIVQFVACEQCMESNWSKYFHYLPEGWIICSEFERIEVIK